MKSLPEIFPTFSATANAAGMTVMLDLYAMRSSLMSSSRLWPMVALTNAAKAAGSLFSGHEYGTFLTCAAQSPRAGERLLDSRRARSRQNSPKRIKNMFLGRAQRVVIERIKIPCAPDSRRFVLSACRCRSFVFLRQ